MAQEHDPDLFPIRIQGKKLAVTDALRGYVAQKLAKIPRHFDHVQEAQVVLSVTRDRNVGRAQAAEVTLWCDGLVVRAVESSPDMYASIDRAVEKLERQIRKYRSRIIEKRRLDESRRRRLRRQGAEVALRAGPPALAEGASGPPSSVRIVRTKRFPMKPMTAEEAALQMELLDHAFFVFRNAATQDLNVLYRRQDGGYGLIEPED